MKRIKSKNILGGFLALVMLTGTIASSNAFSMFAAVSPDSFAWNFSELSVGYPIGENIAAESQNTHGQGQQFFADVDHRAFTAVQSAGYYGTNSESAGNLLVDDQRNKWCQVVSDSTAWFILDAGAPVKSKAYAIRGANDDSSYPTRYLHTWTIQGSDSPTGPWTTVSAPGAQGTGWTSNYQLRIFDFDGAAVPEAGFRYYRLEIDRYGNTANGSALGSTTMQFSYFGLVDDYSIIGSTEETPYLMTQVASGVSASWAGNRPTMNGPNVLTVNGGVNDSDSETVAAKSYTTIKSGLNIPVYADTKLGYMFAPEGVSASLGTNTYDYNYHGAHMAVDLKFSDGTRLKDLGATDQYGIGMHPVDQGEGKVLKTYQWNYVESEIGKFAAGKTVTDIILGFEMPDATPGHKAAGSFDDLKIFRDDRDYMEIEPADFVDIRQGTNAAGNATGANMPAVARPNPFQYFVPTTTGRTDSNKYAWADNIMHGITTSKLASRHMGERLTFLLMANATTSDYTAANVNNAVLNSSAGFSHDNEFAVSNYHYGVTFNEDDARAPGVSLEVTPTTYGAVFRFTFPADAAARNIVIAAPQSTTANRSALTGSDTTFSGWAQAGSDTDASSTGNSAMRRQYIYGDFDATPTFHTPADSSINTLVSFPALDNGPNGETVVEMRLATSFLSADQAEANFSLDLTNVAAAKALVGGKWFDAVKAEAKAEWNDLLGTVTINDDSANYWQLSNFYSKLARANLYPTLLSEYTREGTAGGWQYASPYRGTNINPVAMDGYMIYNEGWWDTFKSKWPLIGFLRPQAAADLTDGIIQHYIDQDGRGVSNGEPQPALRFGHAVPRWINPGGNNMMTGTSSDAVISDMYAGYDIDFNNVMDGYFSWIKSSAVVTPNSAYGGRTGLHEGIFKGYHPWGSSAPAGGGGQLDTTWSLEGYINDAAQVHMLKKLAAEVDESATIEGKSGAYWQQRWLEEAKYYENRAKYYVNLFDLQQPADYNGASFTAGWMMNRNSDGTFRRQSPLNWGSGYTEDNAWPYRVLVPQDGKGLANLLGSAMNLPGATALRVALDEGFLAEGTNMDYVGGGYGGWIHEGYEKREVKLGQFGLSNQTAYHMPWMYLHSDQPWQTQYWTRTAIARMYSGEAIGYGYMGEEDNGASASWMVWASLGLYPLDLGGGQLVISSPAFKNIEIQNDLGKKITINAPENSFENVYIQSMQVNGEDYHKLYLEADLLKEDLTIDYVMGSEPNENWFTEAPPSLTTDDAAPNVLKDLADGVAVTEDAIEGDQNTVAISVANMTDDSEIAYLFDNSSTTITPVANDQTASVTYYDPLAPKLSIYTLTSSDTVGGAPSNWTLSASQNGEDWVELDARQDESFDWARYTRPFAIDESKQGNYRYYKLDFTATAEALPLRLTEIEFLAEEEDWVVRPVFDFSEDSLTVTAAVTNNTFDDSDAAELYVAVYDADGKLVDYTAQPVGDINARSAADCTLTLDGITAAGEDYTIKVFLWDGSMVPMASVGTY